MRKLSFLFRTRNRLIIIFILKGLNNGTMFSKFVKYLNSYLVISSFRLINKISPNSVKRIQKKGTKFTFMENIEAYQKASAAYGVPEEDRFMPTDLVEARNLKAVTKGLYALGRTVGLMKC